MSKLQAAGLQVKRAEFDALLLDHARESGAAVFEEARVRAGTDRTRVLRSLARRTK
jgi:flavin-dependent dehydrogenase